MFEYELTILEHHLDTFGHVNNATYAEIYEEARWDLITKNGYGLDEVQSSRIGPVILEMNIKFIKEIKLRTKIKILTQAVNPEKKISIIEQKMVLPNGDVASEAKFTFGLFNLDERKLVPPPEKWLKAVSP